MTPQSISCEGKRKFKDKYHANSAVYSMRRSGKLNVHPYKCECGAWHIGHNPGFRAMITRLCLGLTR